MKNNWNKYMAGAVGDKGYYINKIYGPFKTKKIAEFFNFLAFCSPRSLDVEAQSKNNITYLDTLDKPKHPSLMFSDRSHFGIWWLDTYGGPFTDNIMLNLAKECNAMGYKSFTNWLVRGGTIKGVAPHCQYCSTLT